MPCDTRQTTITDLKRANLAIIGKALVAMGCSNVLVTGDTVTANHPNGLVVFRGGVLTTSQGSPVAVRNVLARAYSAAAVGYVAKKYGWQQTQNADGSINLVKATQ